jgi:hypothetical protein
LLHVTRVVGDAWWSSMPCATSTGLHNAGFDALAEHLTRKLRKDGQQPSHAASTHRRLTPDH